jgi:hypothetical protein
MCMLLAAHTLRSRRITTQTGRERCSFLGVYTQPPTFDPPEDSFFLGPSFGYAKRQFRPDARICLRIWSCGARPTWNSPVGEDGFGKRVTLTRLRRLVHWPESIGQSHVNSMRLVCAMDRTSWLRYISHGQREASSSFVANDNFWPSVLESVRGPQARSRTQRVPRVDLPSSRARSSGAR